MLIHVPCTPLLHSFTWLELGAFSNQTSLLGRVISVVALRGKLGGGAAVMAPPSSTPPTFSSMPFMVYTTTTPREPAITSSMPMPR